jgi:hypothetical protein
MAILTHISDRRLAIDDLDKSIVNLSARINGSTYELLVLIREFDESPEGRTLDAPFPAARIRASMT